MTAYLTFKAIKQGTIKIDQVIPVSEKPGVPKARACSST